MAFWSDNFGADATIKDPKRKFRFKVEFTGMGTDSVAWWAKTSDKPSFTIAATEHKYLNHTFYYPGAVTWNEVSIAMVDPGDPDMAATISALVEGGGYHPPVGSGDLSTMTKATAVSSLGDVICTQVDAFGNEIEKWTLFNAFISDVKYGELAYGDDELSEITLTFKYDWAILETTGKGSSAVGSGLAPDGTTTDLSGQTKFFAGSTASDSGAGE